LPAVVVVVLDQVLQLMQPIAQHTQTVLLYLELPEVLVQKVVMAVVVADYMAEQVVVVLQIRLESTVLLEIAQRQLVGSLT
jgi:hypothetical protein